MPNPWYQTGLAFECTRCGRCCGGAPGYVWVDEKDVRQIAGYIGETVDDFRDRYVRRVGNRMSLIEKTDYDCIFLDKEKGCSIYPVRPQQCRTWPFWESNVSSPEAWERTRESCPGAGQGKLFSAEEITKNLRMIHL